MRILVLVSFGLSLFVSIILVANTREPDLMRMEFGITWIARVVGIFMAAVSSLVLLLKGLEGATMESMLPLTLPFLAGVVLIEPHWTMALALAAVVLGVSIGLVIGTRTTSRRDPEQPSGGVWEPPEGS